MNKNSIIGFVLIGVIMFGFTWYQSKQYEKQAEVQIIAHIGIHGVKGIQNVATLNPNAAQANGENIHQQTASQI